jgi:hypothetical protein
MYWLINTFPWLSFIALFLGYMGLLVLASIIWFVLIELFKDWRRDRDMARRIAKIDVEMRHGRPE